MSAPMALFEMKCQVSSQNGWICVTALALQGVLISRMKLRFFHTELGFSLNGPKTEPHRLFLKKLGFFSIHFQ